MGDHRCPRRGEIGQRSTDASTPDEWRSGVGITGQPRGCSYCGSMHPDDFMQAVRDGHEVGPTDKNYKVYLLKRDALYEGKFYFQHLSREQMQEFVDMMSAKTMNIGYPGHFYRLPFFAYRPPFFAG